MRTIFAAIIFSVLVACGSQLQPSKLVPPEAKISVVAHVAAPAIDSTIILKDSIASLRQQLSAAKVVIRFSDNDARAKLERIKVYVAICEKRATNKKFFYGWIKRAIK